MHRVSTHLFLTLLLSITLGTACAEDATAPFTFGNRDERLAWWQDARFGMFIHWGPVSLTGHEIGWSRGRQTPIAKYDNLYKEFNPVKFDADAWARTAKEAGMKYMVLTTKHHDGFCLWDTKQTDYNVMNSPFGRDVVKELAAACREHGIAFGTYYSVCDWHHPGFPLTSPGGRVRRKTSNLDQYTEYLRKQVAELIRNYGPLSTIWFDVPQEFTPERGKPVVEMVRSLQPDILINNRAYRGRGTPVGDYDTPEQHVGGYNDQRPWETCMTICRQWAWKPNDSMKSLAQCIRTLLHCAGGDGNLLFNVGPTPAGEIEARQVKRLEEMGAWLRKYGESVYGTRGGPYRPGAWGACTRKGDTLYLHVMKWPKDGLRVATIPRKIVASSLLTGGTVDVAQDAEGFTIRVPEGDRREIATIVKLELDGTTMDLPAMSISPPALTHKKKAAASNTYQEQSTYAPGKAVDDNPGTRWATDAGTHQAWLEVDLQQPTSIGRVEIDEAYAGRVEKFQLQCRNTKDEEWEIIFAGAKLGETYVKEFDPVTARYVRLNILEASEGPTLNEFRLFKP